MKTSRNGNGNGFSLLLTSETTQEVNQSPNLNGSNVNGSNVNGSNVNGSIVNGSNVNGSNVNGSNVNSSGVDGPNANSFNDSNVNGSKVDELFYLPTTATGVEGRIRSSCEELQFGSQK